MRPARAATGLLLLTVACTSRLCRDPSVWTETTVDATKVAAPPTIDGDLSDPAWQQVPWTPDLRRSMSMEAPRQRTRAKLAWDDTTLYVAFEVADDEVLTPFTADDQPLYESEVVEIFLDANDDGASYDEIELSPADRLFDASFVGRRTGMNTGWSSGTRHAVKLDGTLNVAGDTDRGWTAELAIPFANLTAVPHLPPQPGERWRMNLFRLDHGRGGVEGIALSPVMIGDFHNLPKYAHLRFVAP
jgi:hypothetical protein